MAQPAFADRGDHWVLPLAGRTLHRLCVDHGVGLESLQPEPRSVLRLEGRLTFDDAGTTHVVDVERDRASISALLVLVGRTVERAVATKEGALEVVFEDGSRITADPDEDYEGWALTEDSGFKAVQVPQQGVVIWRGDH